MYSCVIFLMCFPKGDSLLYVKTIKKGMQAWIVGEKRFCTMLKCVWNGSNFELHVPIASNKNGWQFYKNEKTMIRTTKT